ncbi:MAG: UrcA family protein [Gammaproteobacteria bacterium]
MNTTIQSQLRAAICCVCGATGLCALQGTAGAAVDNLTSRTVSYADLDISKPAGAKTLYRRIVAAAQQVCVLGFKDLGAAQQDRTCAQQAIDSAVKAVNAAALSDLRPAASIHLASK